LNGAGDRHIFYNYNLGIPASSTINGIEVRLDWWLDSTSDTNSLSVQLSWDGGTSWTSAKKASTLSTSDGNPTDTLGGSSDTWGNTWTVDDFTNANFRCKISAASDDANGLFLDVVKVRMSYPGCPGDRYDLSHYP
jgi:hypothetical protein